MCLTALRNSNHFPWYQTNPGLDTCKARMEKKKCSLPRGMDQQSTTMGVSCESLRVLWLVGKAYSHRMCLAKLNLSPV